VNEELRAAEKLVEDARRENFDKAFAKAQANFAAIKLNKTGQVGPRKYKYADLAAVLEATVPALNAEGMSMRQSLVIMSDEAPDMMVCTTTVTLDGYEEESPGFPIGFTKDDPQAIGKAATYARRYDLCAFLGVVGEEDTDAADLKQKKEKPPEQPPKQEAPEEPPAPVESTGDPSTTEQGDIGGLLMDGLELAAQFPDGEVQRFWEGKLREKHEAGNPKVLSAMVESVRKQVEKQ